jgi:hypothetical protein
MRNVIHVALLCRDQGVAQQHVVQQQPVILQMILQMMMIHVAQQHVAQQLALRVELERVLVLLVVQVDLVVLRAHHVVRFVRVVRVELDLKDIQILVVVQQLVILRMILRLMINHVDVINIFNDIKKTII